MRLFAWFRRHPREPVIRPLSEEHYRFKGHDQSKGAIAFAKSKADALAIRRQARVESQTCIHRVK